MSQMDKVLILLGAVAMFFAVFGGLHALPACRFQRQALKWVGLFGALLSGGYAMSPGLIDKHVPIIGYADNTVALLAFAFSAATYYFAKELAAGQKPLPAAEPAGG